MALVGYGLQTGGHLHEGLPDRLLGCEFGEPPTLGGLLAQEIFEISHRTSHRGAASVDLSAFLSFGRLAFLAATGTHLANRGAAKMRVAPIPRLASGLECHRLDVRPGDDEMVADVPHG
jgi:hypothetical protein